MLRRSETSAAAMAARSPATPPPTMTMSCSMVSRSPSRLWSGPFYPVERGSANTRARARPGLGPGRFDSRQVTAGTHGRPRLKVDRARLGLQLPPVKLEACDEELRQPLAPEGWMQIT